ncbi:hypothetical protein V8C40DRAFT_232758 [Trichoderma camerunense]
MRHRKTKSSGVGNVRIFFLPFLLLRLFSAMLTCLFRLIAVILTRSKTMIEPQVRCGALSVFWTQAGEVGGYKRPWGVANGG